MGRDEDRNYLTVFLFFFSLFIPHLHFPSDAHHLKCTVNYVSYKIVIVEANQLILYVKFFHNCIDVLCFYSVPVGQCVCECECVCVKKRQPGLCQLPLPSSVGVCAVMMLHWALLCYVILPLL